MPLPLDFVASLKVASIEESIAKSKPGSDVLRSLHEIRNEIKPIDLFCYLGARFGPPNGMQNMLRNNSSDNLVHWDWTLKYENSLIFIWGTNFRTDVSVLGDLIFTEVDRDELIRQILVDVKVQGSKMRLVKKELERWTEFVNPYWRLTRSISSLRTELAQLNLLSEFSKGFNTPSTAVEQADLWNEVSNSYSKAFGLCFGIRSMLPVWAEAFINLVIAIHARTDIKADSRLMDSMFRLQIDIRIKSLHINCECFEKAVDYSFPICKKFHTLINERNDLLHGNVVPEKHKFNEVYFLGNVPVFTEYRSLWDRTIAVDSKAVGLERLEEEFKVVTDFIEYVYSCMQPKAREYTRAMASRRDIGKNQEDGRFEILFPRHLIDSRLGFERK